MVDLFWQALPRKSPKLLLRIALAAPGNVRFTPPAQKVLPNIIEVLTLQKSFIQAYSGTKFGTWTLRVHEMYIVTFPQSAAWWTFPNWSNWAPLHERGRTARAVKPAGASAPTGLLPTVVLQKGPYCYPIKKTVCGILGYYARPTFYNISTDMLFSEMSNAKQSTDRRNEVGLTVEVCETMFCILRSGQSQSNGSKPVEP